MYSSMRQTLIKEPRLIMTRTSPPATWSSASPPRTLRTTRDASRDNMSSSMSEAGTQSSRTFAGRPHRSIPLEMMGSVDMTRSLPRASLSSLRSSPVRSSPVTSNTLRNSPATASSPRSDTRSDVQLPGQAWSYHRQHSQQNLSNCQPPRHQSSQLTKQQNEVRQLPHDDVLNKSSSAEGDCNWTLQSTPVYRGTSGNNSVTSGSNSTLTSPRRPRLTTGSDGTFVPSKPPISNDDSFGGYRVYKGKSTTDLDSETTSLIKDSADILKSYQESMTRYQSSPNVSSRYDRQTKQYGGLPKGPRSPRPQLVYSRGALPPPHSASANLPPDRPSDARTSTRPGHRPWWKNPKLKDDWSQPRVVTCSASLTGKPRMTSFPLSPAERLTDRADSEPPTLQTTCPKPLHRREVSSPSLNRLDTPIVSNYKLDMTASTPADHTHNLVNTPTQTGSRSPSPQPKSILKNSSSSSRATPSRARCSAPQPAALRPRRSKSASGAGRGSRYDLVTSRTVATPRRKSVTFSQQVEMSMGGHVFNMAALHPQLDV